jgi:death-on-curing protein
MIVLTKEQILKMHEQVLARFGGEKGIREEGLFDSAVTSPFQSFGGVDLYPTVEEKAARLGFCLIKNHCLIDGNKRTGTHAMLVLLALNGVELRYTQKDLYETIIDVAAGKSGYEKLVEWIKKRTIVK